MHEWQRLFVFTFKNTRSICRDPALHLGTHKSHRNFPHTFFEMNLNIFGKKFKLETKFQFSSTCPTPL